MILEQLPAESRVWLYQSDRALDATEIQYVKEQLVSFTAEWAAHGKKLWAGAEIVNPYFLIVGVDESITPPSGCSIDASVKFIKALGAELEVDFFNRLKVTIDSPEGMKQIGFHDLKNLDSTTLVYDSLETKLSAVRNSWPVALRESNFAPMLDMVR